jgi:hypothetical protein
MALRCVLACEREEREAVYRLRYRCYFRKGSIAAREDRMFHDRFDETPNHFSFLARDENGDAVGTFRAGVVTARANWIESPAGAVFGDHPAYEQLARGGYAEASRLCFGRAARRDALMGLFGHLAALADRFETEWLVACPREEHAPVYERLFGFRAMAEPRRYYGVDFETKLLAIRREELRKRAEAAGAMRGAWRSALNGLQAVSGGR